MKMLLSLTMLMSFSAFADSDVCAVAYNSLNPDYSSVLELRDGDRIKNLNQIRLQTGGDWDNKISALRVKNGCTVVAYQYQNFNVNYHTNHRVEGFTQVFENPNRHGFRFIALDSYTNEKISSIKCYCPN